MKSITRRGCWALVIVLTGAFFRTDPAVAEILFKADFETGDLSQFSGKSKTIKPGDIEVVTDIVRSGKYSGRFTIHEDDVFNARQLRAQVNGPKVTVKEGSDTFVSFFMYMKDAPKDRDNFFYWEGSPPPGYNNVMTWWVEPKKDGTGTLIKYGTGNLGRKGVHWQADFTIGQWHQLGMHIHWSEDPEKGNVKLWWDGSLALYKKVQTKGPQTVYFSQPGIHRDPHTKSVDTIYFDDFLCATTLDEIELQKPVAKKGSVLSAMKSGDSVVVESKGGPLTYKPVIDPKNGGNITQLNLPADGNVVARELNDLFFLGDHGEEYTLRGWTGRDKCTISCAVDLVSQKPDEVVVKVDLITTGTYKILVTDEAAKANLRKTHLNYKDKTLEVKRTYTFKPDRIVIDDQMLWVHPDTQMKTFYVTSAFTPGSIQGPARLVNGATATSFYVQSSSGKKVPEGIVFPSTAENFLKNGFKVSLRTTATSFDLGKSDMYFYERPWQQDWFQISGFMFRVGGSSAGKPIKASHEVVFSKASASEMPPVVTIKSPSWDARWLDEKGEVPKFKIGDTVKLSGSAVNSDGSAVPDADINWEIYIFPWPNTPPVALRGANATYTLPDFTNEVDKAKSKDREILGVITVIVKGKNGTEAVEPFAMLVGRKGQ
jgi:Polysaccharide lyase